MNIIVAIDSKNGIGKNNGIPWHLREDLKYFKQVTTKNNISDQKNIVVMGRKTWDSIPEKYKPLSGRMNIILTRNRNKEYKESIESNYENTYIKYDFDEITAIADVNKHCEIYIIGGSSIYEQALYTKNIRNIYITEVYQNFDCDTFFPNIDKNIFNIESISDFKCENNIYYRYLKCVNVQYINKLKLWYNTEEDQYLNCLKNILENGIETDDRTGVGTLSIFGEKFTYNLEDTLPILTTKRQFFRAIFEELNLYISGKTDNSILNDKNIHIWNGNTTRDFLDKRNLHHYPEHDMGETYGFNFRHYGANYIDCKQDYSEQGFDQLSYVINLIKTDPNSRRIIINLWNPHTMHKAALPACLCMYQFYVDTKKNKLNLQIYIRSSDFFLANNWNTVTGALLVHMICNLTGIKYTPGKLTVITGDTHIYKSHIEQIKENLTRSPFPFPKLVINNEKENIENYTYEDFKLIGYKAQKNIGAPMAI